MKPKKHVRLNPRPQRQCVLARQEKDREKKEAPSAKQQRKIERRKEARENKERKRQKKKEALAKNEKNARKQANRLEQQRLEGELRKLNTRDDFVNAMHYRHAFTEGHDEEYRYQMLHRYLVEKCKFDRQDRLRFWVELKLFELTDQILNYFFPNQKLDSKGTEEFFNTAKMFFNLAGCNSLSLLELETVKIEDERIAGDQCTTTEKLKYYLERYKMDKGFDEWTPERMHSLSRTVHEALQISLTPARPAPKAPEDPDVDSSNTGSSNVVTNSREVDTRGSRTPNNHSSASRALSPARKPTVNNGTIKLENGEPANCSPMEQHSRSVTIKSEPLSDNVSFETFSDQVQKELLSLEALLGDITTATQIERASLYHDDLYSHDKRDEVKAEAWKRYIHSDKVDTQRMWLDLGFWRLMREIPSGVVDFYVIGDGYLGDELLLLAQRWMFLAASGGLGELEQCQEVRAVKEKRGTPAEVLAAFLENYRRKKGFAWWTWRHMSDARLEVIRVWNKCQPKRSLASENLVETSVAKRVKREDENTTSSKKHTLGTWHLSSLNQISEVSPGGKCGF